MFNKLLKTTAVALFCAASLTATLAEARQMRVSSFEPAQGFYSSKILQPWIDKVNARLSKGTEFKLYPGSILGAPPAQADLVKAGVADVALVVPTYTPGVFPLTGLSKCRASSATVPSGPTFSIPCSRTAALPANMPTTR